MNNDTIKRSDAIKALRKLGHEVVVVDKVCSLGVATEFIDVIRTVPSADRPQGKWIGGEIPTRCPICEHDWDEYVFGQEYFYTGDIPKYCPNCGTRLEV